MVVLWLTLLLLQKGFSDSLPQMISVQLGEPVTLTCVSPNVLSTRLLWYKQRAGETLTLLVRLQTYVNPMFGAEFSPSRFDVGFNMTMSNLTILRTIEEDEGMYHCGGSEWTEVTWRGMYLSLKGNSRRTSNLTVVQQPPNSDSVHPGASVSLQCSDLSDSESKTCPAGPSVFWFRARSDKSHPGIIYADEAGCEKRSDAQKSCVYHSKNISSSDAENSYCAVAACGRMLFGDGSKLQISMIAEQTASFEVTGLLAVIVCLAISVIFNVFTCFQKPRAEYGVQMHQQTDEDLQVYSAVVFTLKKSARGGVKNTTSEERKRIRAALKSFG